MRNIAISPRKSKRYPTRPKKLTVLQLPSTPAGRFICRKYPISPELADLVATLAGLGREVA
jgi:hypothetical protein